MTVPPTSIVPVPCAKPTGLLCAIPSSLSRQSRAPIMIAAPLPLNRIGRAALIHSSPTLTRRAHASIAALHCAPTEIAALARLKSHVLGRICDRRLSGQLFYRRHLFIPNHGLGSSSDYLEKADDQRPLVQECGDILPIRWHLYGRQRRWRRSHFFAGDAVNFNDEGSAPVREFGRENAAYWVREFHFDGLRLDATQQIFDTSPRNIIAELTVAAREAAGGRSVLVVAENEPQEARLVRPEPRGYGVDGVWNEDLHHAAHVTLTARCEAYYSDYTGSARELLACVKHGFLYQRQRST